MSGKHGEVYAARMRPYTHASLEVDGDLKKKFAMTQKQGKRQIQDILDIGEA